LRVIISLQYVFTLLKLRRKFVTTWITGLTGQWRNIVSGQHICWVCLFYRINSFCAMVVIMVVICPQL